MVTDVDEVFHLVNESDADCVSTSLTSRLSLLLPRDHVTPTLLPSAPSVCFHFILHIYICFPAIVS